MYLIDTTVWLALFRGEPEQAAGRFEALIESGAEYGLTGAIYQEVLQEAASRRSFRQMKVVLETQHVFEPADSLAAHTLAAELYARWCQDDEIADGRHCLIAALAMEHGLRVVHADSRFERLAAIEPEFVTELVEKGTPT